MHHFSAVPYNQRQIKIMAHELDTFLHGKSSLGVLVKQLKGLFWALESPDPDWRDDFLSEWGALETTYALELEKKEQGLTSDIDAKDQASPSSAFAFKSAEKLSDIVRKEIME